MGCLFIFVPTSILFANCSTRHSAEKCLQLIMNWEICVLQKKLLANIIWQTAVLFCTMFNSSKFNSLNNCINPQSSIIFIWSLTNVCTKPPQGSRGWLVELEHRGRREGKLVAFPQILRKIRGRVPISLFLLTRGLVFPFIHLVLHYSPTPFVMVCLASPSDILSNRIFALSWLLKMAVKESLIHEGRT